MKSESREEDSENTATEQSMCVVYFWNKGIDWVFFSSDKWNIKVPRTIKMSTTEESYKQSVWRGTISAINAVNTLFVSADRSQRK